jgi:hypothetical protein
MRIKNIINSVLAATLILSLPMHAYAEEGMSKKKSAKVSTKTYNESEFIKTFSNKTRQQVADILGKPESTSQGRKPSQGEASMANVVGTKSTSHNDNVEMWYYAHKVRYDAKHTYSKVELTFMNDRCQNVAYFNEKK